MQVLLVVRWEGSQYCSPTGQHRVDRDQCGRPEMPISRNFPLRSTDVTVRPAMSLSSRPAIDRSTLGLITDADSTEAPDDPRAERLLDHLQIGRLGHIS